jgi:hypothetical protein
MKRFLSLIFLVVLVASCKKEPVLPPETIIIVTSDEDTLDFNTNETAEIKIELMQHNPNARVDIKVTGGKIDGQTEWKNVIPENLKIVKTVVPDGVGKCTVTATISGTQYYASKTIVVENAPGNGVLSLQASPPVPADNLSFFTVTADISNTTATHITFNTSRGQFENGLQTITRAITSSQVSEQVTVSQSALLHIISCTLVGTSYTDEVYFTPVSALAETLNLSTSSWTIDSTDLSSADAFSLTAQLGRSQGKVTIGRLVEAEAYQVQSGVQVNFGSFTGQPLRTDADEKVTTTYFASPGLDPDLPLYIVLKTQGESGVVSDTITIDVLAP